MSSRSEELHASFLSEEEGIVYVVARQLSVNVDFLAGARGAPSFRPASVFHFFHLESSSCFFPMFFSFNIKMQLGRSMEDESICDG